MLDTDLFKVWWLCCSLLSHWTRNTEYHICNYVYWPLHNICITDVQLHVPIAIHNQVLSLLVTYHGIFKMGAISGAGFDYSSAVVAFTRVFLIVLGLPSMLLFCVLFYGPLFILFLQAIYLFFLWSLINPDVCQGYFFNINKGCFTIKVALKIVLIGNKRWFLHCFISFEN